MGTHFSRMQQLDEFPTLQDNSLYKGYHEKDTNSSDTLPLSWQNDI